ncbi:MULTISPECIES: bestrophin family protein [unclassified Acidovorax]|uniref:bestrophin family protein n=1 Tax=unclassified Acidovorax TaxID=2684926 RepID=UPI002883458B|nr:MULTISPECIES: bestrophin family protein [unclassified Acidovorax]
MIVHDRPTGFQLFWILRGSVLHRIRFTLAVNVALAVVVTGLHGYVFNTKVVVTMAPFTLIGLPIAIFLGFRNNTAYARYWEARNLWGEIIFRSRSLSRQCLGLIRVDEPVDPNAVEGDVRVRMVRRAVAFAHALRLQLRGQQDDALLQRWITRQDGARIQPSSNRADALMQAMGRDLGECVREGRIDQCLAVPIDQTLTALASTAAGCERIRHTPVPFSYTLLLTLTCFFSLGIWKHVS